MSKHIYYDGHLHEVFDEDDKYYLIDERWHPSEPQTPRLVEISDSPEEDYVLDCGINWATDECATKELAERYFAQREAEGHFIGSYTPQYDETLGVWRVHFHW